MHSTLKRSGHSYFRKEGRPGLVLFILGMVAIFSGCPAQHQSGGTNRLINESSPYLLQHAKNPVDWYPWGDEALDRAKTEGKSLIISIGYSSCHWCHVMEEESFENDSVAAFMNEHFVCIKIDREERPDIDKIYIEAAQMITGNAGWPLNCVAMPDGRPFFAGTYFPRDQWMSLLSKIAEMWITERPKLESISNQVAAGIGAEVIFENPGLAGWPGNAQLESVVSGWMQGMDTEYGGYDRVPKFPLPSGFETLLTYAHLTGSEKAMDQVKVTLDRMAMGGIYDHLAGGFARYSTDKYWKVPHFEKMLYDNGLLLSLYARAYALTSDPVYKSIIDRTISFMERDWQANGGGFYSSFDADSEGLEGTYYVWSKSEIAHHLKDDAEIFNEFYNVTTRGNWEHGNNILYTTSNVELLSERSGKSPEKVQLAIERSEEKLLKVRRLRVAPGLDNKVLASWNALAISGLVDAFRATRNEDYLKMAEKAAEFIDSALIKKDFRMDRNFMTGKSSINAFLDDYAFAIAGFIDLYQATFKEAYLYKARDLANYVIEHFSDTASSMFFYTSDLDSVLIARKIDYSDQVIPSANSVMAHNLFLLGKYFYQQQYIDRSDDMLAAIVPQLMEHPDYFTHWLELLLLRTSKFYEVAIVGPEYERLKADMDSKVPPNCILLGGNELQTLKLLENKFTSGITRIYVCVDKMCKMPVTDVQKALEQLVPDASGSK